MTPSSFLVLLPALLGLAGSGAVAPGETRIVVAQNTVVLKIPLRPLAPPRVEWVERKGPSCIPAESIRAAKLSGPSQVDFIVGRGQLVRAELADDCPALDFYSDFYVSPEDDEVCAGRDVIRSRIGGSCRIERFRELVPRLRR